LLTKPASVDGFTTLIVFTDLSFTLHVIMIFFFFFNAPATTDIYTLSLHDALPIYREQHCLRSVWRTFWRLRELPRLARRGADKQDRKSTRLNSSHRTISYAVFCLKKKTQNATEISDSQTAAPSARALQAKRVHKVA